MPQLRSTKRRKDEEQIKTKQTPDMKPPTHKQRISTRDVAKNFMRVNPANRISEILANQRKAITAFAQTDRSHCLADRSSCWKCRAPAHLMSSEHVLRENKVKLPNLC